MKNGEGVLTLHSGAKIQTTWKDDQKNGRAYATNEKGVRGQVEFFEDILVSKSDQNPYYYNWAPLNVILVLCVFGLAYYIKTGNYKEKNKVGLWIFLLLLYIAYIVERAMCRTQRFITTIIQSQKASELITDQKSKAPKVTFWLSNYHYEWRHRSGKHRYKRVTSSNFQRELRFAECFDKSPIPILSLT